jgi:hypothetical protein
MMKHTAKLFFVLTFFGMNTALLAEPTDDPCAGESALLNLVDRPTASDSACAVPLSKGIIEAGIEYQKLYSSGYQTNFPAAELRVGLPANNELSILLPNYLHQTVRPYSGNTATEIAIKHEIGYNKNWLGAVEAVFTPPSSNAAFGSDGFGTAINGIVSYTFNEKFNFNFQLGASTQTASSYNGGQRYNSINPDAVFTYSPTKKIDTYIEVYGQTKTSSDQTSGFNSDVGVLFLILPKVEIDVEIGQRISGTLAGFNHYVGTGFAVEIN